MPVGSLGLLASKCVHLTGSFSLIFLFNCSVCLNCLRNDKNPACSWGGGAQQWIGVYFQPLNLLRVCQSTHPCLANLKHLASSPAFKGSFQACPNLWWYHKANPKESMSTVKMCGDWHGHRCTPGEPPLVLQPVCWRASLIRQKQLHVARIYGCSGLKRVGGSQSPEWMGKRSNFMHTRVKIHSSCPYATWFLQATFHLSSYCSLSCHVGGHILFTLAFSAFQGQSMI